MKETIKTIIEWQANTFPDATLDGQIIKFKEEKKEYDDAQNMQELADMFIVACGIARFDSVVALEYFNVVYKALRPWKKLGVDHLLQDVIEEKMTKNRKRVWRKTTEGAYHHENGIED